MERIKHTLRIIFNYTKVIKKIWYFLVNLKLKYKIWSFITCISVIFGLITDVRAWASNNIRNIFITINQDIDIEKNIHLEEERVICENFFMKSKNPIGIENYKLEDSLYTLAKEDIIFADLKCDEKIPINFGLRLTFIPRNNKVINLGVTEYTQSRLHIFRIIIGDGDDRSVVVKDSEGKNFKIRRYNEEKFTEKITLNNSISQNNKVSLELTQYEIKDSEVKLTMTLIYRPAEEEGVPPVKDTFDILVDNDLFSSNIDYLIGIGLFRSSYENEETSVELVDVKITDQTL